MIHNISRFIAALALLATAQGAWADTETVSYIDADGNAQTVTATVLTGNEEPSRFGTIDLDAGWYVVKGNISYTNQISYASYPSGTIHIILADGAQMAVEHNGSAAIFLGNDNPLAIYGQSAGTGRLSVTSDSYAISALGGITINGGIVSATSTGYGRPAIFAYNGAITINGGQVTATPGNNAMGISTEGTITLGLRSASDFITANGYNGTVNIKSGQTLYAGATAYSGNNVSLPSGAVTIRPYSSDDFSVNDAGTEYTIKTAAGWNVFCDLLADNTFGYFTGKTVCLGADIGTADAPVTRMAGASGKEFTGTFDGQGNTLTVNYANTGNNVMTAPFSYVDGATIRNLIVDGTISGSAYRAAGVIGETGTNKSYITNCVSSLTISSGRYTAGFSIGGNVEIEGCVFNGKIVGTQYSGGFIGYSKSAQVIKNSLFAPKDGSSISGGTFYYNGGGDVDPVNSYYTRALGTAQGKALHSVTAGDDVTLALSGTATEYTVSGITAYEGNQGIKYGTTYYAGSGDVVSLTLSNTATGAPAGYKYGYTASAGTLSGSTLTMPAEDVTISVNTAVLTAIPWDGDGTEGSPYIIKYASQLDLLAYRVNGTHGETCQTDGYKDTYFQLANDISYTHTSDWDAFDSDENNYEAIGGYYNGNWCIFCGHFDGNNNTISGIRIYKNGKGSADNYQGIFGQADADIHDLTLADARITGCSFTGGIVSRNYGTVSRCHVADNVAACAVQSEAWYHGGIAGVNDGGTIEQCTSAATLTTADATSTQYYGGIVGRNYNGGTLRDNLAIGATVPATANNSYGAITGYNDDDGTLQRNYYTACKVADVENATGVGCKNADVTANNGAVSIHTLTLADGITTSTPVTVTIGTTGYYAQGTAIALSYSGTPGNIPDGYQYEDGDGFTASAGTINGSTLTMPDQDVTVSLALRSTHAAVPVSYVDADGNTVSGQTAIALDGTETELVSYDDQERWYFVGLPTVAFDHRLYLNGNVHLILADGCTMNVTSNADGIDVFGSLTIYGQTEGTGTLNATSDYGYGIFTNRGTITISGGRVTATSKYNAGITTNIGNITISGGRVTATGDDGIYSESGTITISGGRVTATSDNGYGIHTESGYITISGGRVTATGGNHGIRSDSGTITISGGTVTATGGEGIHADSGDITISGGRVTASGGGAGIFTYGGTLTLGWTTASDFIYVSSYDVGPYGMNIANGQTLFDEYGISYSDQIYDYNILKGKTLRRSPGIALTARQAPDGNYWTTYYNGARGFTIDADVNACAYTATYGAGQLTLKKLGKEIPAGTAVIIVAENDVVSMATTDLPAYSGPNDLHGVDDDTDVADIRNDLGDGTLYVLGMTTVDNEQHFGFHRYTGEEMAAHKAYVLVSGGQALARSLTMVFDDATGIESAEADSSLFTLHSSLSTWFTLDGRRLQAKPTAPGIYVNNGRKVVIK